MTDHSCNFEGHRLPYKYNTNSTQAFLQTNSKEGKQQDLASRVCNTEDRTKLVPYWQMARFLLTLDSGL
jgi:hypothetical protein